MWQFIFSLGLGGKAGDDDKLVNYLRCDYQSRWLRKDRDKDGFKRENGG